MVPKRVITWTGNEEPTWTILQFDSAIEVRRARVIQAPKGGLGACDSQAENCDPLSLE